MKEAKIEPKHVDPVAILDYVHVYRFIIHIAKQLAKKQLSSIHFFTLSTVSIRVSACIQFDK